jgi:hypothetical protein
VRITPTSAMVGRAAGVPFEIVLNRGQTYSGRAVSQGISGTSIGHRDNTWRAQAGEYQRHNFALIVESNRPDNNLSGSKIEVISGGKIAVTVKDDSIFEHSEDKSGYSGGCEDFIGDQLVSVDKIGNQYIVMKGQLLPTSVDEYCFVVATEDGTTVSVNGIDQGVNLLAGQTIELLLNSDYNHIVTSKNVYVLQTTGFACELAAAILPPINLCTGSYQVGFTRTYGGAGDTQDADGRRFFMNLMVRKGDGENMDGFEVITNGSLNTNATNAIRAANFEDINGNDEWQAARLELDREQLRNGAHMIKNDRSLFHMAFINATSYDFGKGYVLTGSEYGYFSNYNVAEPNAYIVQGGQYKKTAYYDVVKREDIRLFAEGGMKYNWYKYEKYDYSAQEWLDLDIEEHITSTTDYRPSISAPRDTGAYRILVDVHNDCFDGLDTLFAFIIIGPTPPTDTVCTTVPGDFLSSGYNLNNLNQFYQILSQEQLAAGYAIDGWYNRIQSPPLVINNYEPGGINLFSSSVKYFNATGTNNVNPKIESVNFSGNSLGLVKSSANGIDLQQQRTASVEYRFQTALNFSEGNLFTYSYRYNGVELNDPEHMDEFRVYMVLIDDGKVLDSIHVNVKKSNVENPEWASAEFHFNALTTGKVTHMRIGFYSVAYDSGHGFYFDEIERIDPGVYTEITNPENYVFTEMINRVYFKTVNPQIPDYTSFTDAHVWVLPEGRAHRNISVGPTCVSEIEPHCFSLVDFDEAIHDNIIGERVWFSDSDTLNIVDKTQEICIIRDTVFYNVVRDKCAKISVLSFNITSIPVLNFIDTTIVLCADQLLNPDGKHAMVSLNDYESTYFKNNLTKYNFTWYSDAARTIPVLNPASVTVANLDIYYATISAAGKTDCSEDVLINFTVNELPEITINQIDLCDYEAEYTLAATPAGGVFSLNGIELTSILPANYSDQVLPIIYNYTDAVTGCVWTDTADFEIFESPSGSIIGAENTGYGSVEQLSAIVTGGSGDYTYTWTGTLLQTSGSSVDTDNLFDTETFRLLVEDNITACTLALSHTVAVAAKPFSLQLTASKGLICQGHSTYVVAEITDGVGPYKYEWSNGREVLSTVSLLDSILVNPSENQSYSVTVTDIGDRDRVLAETAIVTVALNPIISVDAAANTVCQNTPLSLSVSLAGGTGNMSYAWSGDDAGYLDSNDILSPAFNTTAAHGSYQLNLIATDENNCADTVDLTVTLHELPVLEDKIYQTCSGHDILLNAGGEKGLPPYSWAWSGAGTALLTDTSGQEQSFVATELSLATYIYDVEIVDGNNCKANSSVTVTLDPLPVPAINGDGEVCNENTILLEASPVGSYTYQWKDADALVSELESYQFMRSTSGSYTIKLIVTNPLSGCTDSVIRPITVHKLPELSVEAANDFKVCVSSDIELVANATSDAMPLRYAWSPVANISPADARTVLFRSSVVGQMAYSVLVTDANNCEVSASGNITVEARPPYTSLQDMVICSTTDYQLDLETSLTNSVTWLGSISLIKDSTVPSKPVIYAGSNIVSGSYSISYIISDGFCTSEDSLSIDVNIRPRVSLEPQLPVCSGLVREIDAILSPETSHLSPTYAWTPVAPSSSKYNFIRTEAGDYDVQVVASSQNCHDTAAISVKVVENPTVQILATGIANEPRSWVAYNCPLELTAVAGSGTPGYKYIWNANASNTELDNVQVPNFSFTTDNIYAVTVTDSYGCQAEATRAFYSVYPSVSLRGSGSVCEKEKITLESNVSNFANSIIYRWYLNDNFVELGQSPTIDPSEYLKPLGTGKTLNVRLEVSSACFTEGASSSTSYSVHPNPAASLSVETLFNEADSISDFIFRSHVQSASPGDKLTYTWSGSIVSDSLSKAVVTDFFKYEIPDNLPDNPSIRLRVVDNKGCSADANFGVIILDVSRPDVCVNGIAEYLVYNLPAGAQVQTHNAASSWKYVRSFVPAHNSDEAAYEVYSALYPSADTAKFTVYATHTDPNVLIIGRNIAQPVTSYPVISVYGPADVCVNTFAGYELIANATPPGVFQWLLGTAGEDGVVKYDTLQKNNPFAGFEWNEIGHRYIKLDYDNGCPVSTEMRVRIHGGPLADFSYTSASEILKFTDVSFENKSKPFVEGGQLRYFWDFIGDGVFTSEQDNPIYQYQDMGSYDVYLIAYDPIWGCADTAVVVLNVIPNPNCKLTYPNTMLPEHVNPDYRKFGSYENIGIIEKDFKLTIWNRWGALVYETDSPEAKWDGYYNGSLVQQGTFRYQSTATCENGRVLNQNGEVTVIR